MNRKQLLALLLLRRRIKKRKQNRQYWVHPLNETRDEAGTFYKLFDGLREDESKFYDYFGMSISSFDILHGLIKDRIQRQNTKMRNCIQPVEMLGITLRYLASGCTFTELHRSFRVGISTARLLVREVCQALWNVMECECIPPPTKDIWESVANGFEQKANFPNCIGAVDGKQFRVAGSLESGDSNDKESHSVVLMAVADSEYRFVFVHVGIYPKNCDSSILKHTQLWKSIESDSENLPDAKCLPGTESPKVPYYLVGGKAFGQHKHLLRPYAGKHLTVKKRIFNYRLCRARRYVECALGILSNKWKILQRTFNVQPQFANDIVRACVVLHNYVRDADGYNVEDTMSIVGMQDIPGENTIRGGIEANDVKNILCRYFVSSVGRVPWQESKI